MGLAAESITHPTHRHGGAADRGEGALIRRSQVLRSRGGSAVSSIGGWALECCRQLPAAGEHDVSDEATARLIEVHRNVNRNVHTNVHSPGQRPSRSPVSKAMPCDARAVTGRRSRGAEPSAPCLDCLDGHSRSQWTMPAGKPAGLVGLVDYTLLKAARAALGQ